MVLAAVFHLVQGEISHTIAPVVVFLLAWFVFWGRTKKAPIRSIAHRKLQPEPGF
jgi:hypothetical protein